MLGGVGVAARRYERVLVVIDSRSIYRRKYEIGKMNFNNIQEEHRYKKIIVVVS